MQYVNQKISALRYVFCSFLEKSSLEKLVKVQSEDEIFKCSHIHLYVLADENCLSSDANNVVILSKFAGDERFKSLDLRNNTFKKALDLTQMI